MGPYVARRVMQFLVVLFLGSVAIWALIYAVPGSPAVALVGPDATPDELQAAELRLGLDQPVWQQYAAWLGRALRLDLGRSAITGVPVADQLLQRIPATLQLTLVTMAFSVAIAIPLGVISALRPRSLAAATIGVFQAATLAVPTFWVGILLVLAFSIRQHWLPSVSRFVPLWTNPVEALRNTALPAASMTLYFSSVLSRFVAASLAETLGQDYVRTARSKGVGERRVIVRHALRNAMLPTVTVIGLQLGSLLGGAIVVETVFSYPGLGRLLYAAVTARDYPLVQGAVLFAMLGFLVINLLIDLLYAWLDPRVTLG